MQKITWNLYVICGIFAMCGALSVAALSAAAVFLMNYSSQLPYYGIAILSIGCLGYLICLAVCVVGLQELSTYIRGRHVFMKQARTP